MKNVKDNFSGQSDMYRKFRPTYPQKLLDELCSYPPSHELVWDCGTGTGQIAFYLSNTFKKVIATDISQDQIERAIKKENIVYLVERAEKSSLLSNSVDLIVVAQAIHWFDFDHFYTEAKRVLKGNGIIAILGYPLLTTKNPHLKNLIIHFYKNILGKYWDPERKYIDDRYRTIPFPFKEFSLPRFEMKYDWTLEQLLGYFKSWSAVVHYKSQNQVDPTELIKPALKKIVQAGTKVEVYFEGIGRYGRHE